MPRRKATPSTGTEPAAETASTAPEKATTAEEQPSTPRSKIRSWTVNEKLGYRRESDDNLGIILFKFKEKPPEETLALMKEKGFQFRSLREHGKAWTIRNDWEGRTVADQIDIELMKMAGQLPGRPR